MRIERAYLHPALLGLFLFAIPLTASPPEDPVYKELRAARLDGRRVGVQDLILERDVFRFRFRSGTFHLLQPVAGRTLGAVFLGEGSYRLSPATDNERRHLAMITKEDDFEVLSDTFSDLVLLFADSTYDEIAALGVEDGSPHPEAVDRFDRHLKTQSRELRLNLHLRLLQDLLTDPPSDDGVFIAVVDGKSYPLGMAVVDPRGCEGVSFQSGLGAEDTAFFVRDPESGRFDFWYLSDRQHEIEAGQPEPATVLADAEHYEVETEVFGNDDIRGQTTIRLHPKVGDQRVLPISLMSRLRIEAAEFAIDFGNGQTPWAEMPVIQEPFRQDAQAAVVFPDPMPMGVAVLLRLRYQGEQVLIDVGDNNYVVSARASWYPNLGTFSDTATYDLTYRIPERNRLVSVGELVEEREEEGQQVSHWRSEQPLRVAGFNYGRFKKLERRDESSGIQLEVFTNPGDLFRPPPEIVAGRPEAMLDEIVGRIDTGSLAKSALIDGANMARVGSLYFGELPQRRVAITQQSQAFFGQSWPGLIYLPFTAFLSSTDRAQLGMTIPSGRFEALGFHEFAHQWWGHLIGWHCYRDQWLSEAFAEFSAALAVHHTKGWDEYDELWEEAHKTLFQKSTGSEIANDAAGPISQGWRLASPRARAAYSAVVYQKGAFVLHMLRMLMWDPSTENPDAAFIAMMQDFVRTHSGGNPSTADFQATAERHLPALLQQVGGGRLDWFFDQWVHGTEIPRFRSELTAERVGGGEYRISGSVAQQEVSDLFVSFVPIYVDFGKKRFARIGTLGLVGDTSQEVDFRLTLDQRPRRVLINAHHDVLSR